MESIKVRSLEKEDYGSWDELVQTSPQGTIFHKSDWLSFCAKFLGRDLKIFGCFKDGYLLGGCSFYVFKKGFLKIASSTIAGTPFGGVLIKETRSHHTRKREESLNDVIRSLCIALKNEHFDYIQLVNSPDLVDIRPFTWNGWQCIVYYTYYLDLADFGKNISKEARWIIKKAAESGVTTEKSEDMTYFHVLYKETCTRQRFSPSSEDFFNNLFNLLQDQNKGELWIAKTKSGEAAAAELIIYDDMRAYRWAAASHSELRKTGAPSLLLHEIFEDLEKRGFREVNLMAANKPGLAKFVAQFNPRLVPYYGVERRTTMAKIAEYLLRGRRH